MASQYTFKKHLGFYTNEKNADVIRGVDQNQRQSPWLALLKTLGNEVGFIWVPLGFGTWVENFFGSISCELFYIIVVV
jgi:hypothetical protein